MKNIPSFEDFNKYDSLLERADPIVRQELSELGSSERISTEVNEGKIFNSIKTGISKFLLGGFSKATAIDHGRDVILGLEKDIIEQKEKTEKDIEEMELQIAEFNKAGETEKSKAVYKDKSNKVEEFTKFKNVNLLKIKRAKDILNDLIDNNKRLKEYYEAGKADDEIEIAKLEYEIAKKKSTPTELERYRLKVEEKIKDAEEKAQKIKTSISKEEDEKENPVFSGDSEKEKKAISSRKAKNVIERKRELEKEIADLRATLENKLTAILKKIQKSKDPLLQSYIEKSKLDMLEVAFELDSKTNLLNILRGIGKTEYEINKKLRSESDFRGIAERINKSISGDLNSDTAKIIIEVMGKGKVNSSKIESAISKINKK